MTLKVNDLFCGGGGMGLGFKNAGFDIAGAWDFDKFAVQSYKHNVGDHVQQMSILDMTAEDMPTADVWTFGFPCQDISTAGKGDLTGKTLKEKPRSGLFYEVMRLLDETTDKPKSIVAENVKALKKYLPVIEEEYKTRGYKLYATLYNSKYFNVAQNRERYFCVGVHESITKEFVFAEQDTTNVPKLMDFLQPESEIADRFYLNRLMHNLTMNGDIEVIGTTADSVIKPDGSVIKDKSTSAWVHDVNKRIGTLSARDYKQPKQIIERYPYPVTKDGCSTTITTRSHDAWTETSIKKKMTTIIFNRNGDYYRLRKLTPREYARLQGFPDSYEIVVSNTQAYKQFGNAVTVNVSTAVAETIMEFLRSE